VKRSPLLTSQTLLEDATRCVELNIIVPGDAAAIAKLGATGKLPMALIIDKDGRVIRQVNNTCGVLRPQSVEQMVSEELSRRDDEVIRRLTEAKNSAAARLASA